MKKRYDSSVKHQSCEIGEKVLVYNPKKRRGKFAKWEVRWVGPYTVQNKLNSANYVVKRGRSKPVVIHIDRLRKLPVEMEADSDDRSVHDGALACPPAVTRRSDTAVAAAVSPYPVSDVNRPSTRYAGRYRAVGLGACPPGAGLAAADAYIRRCLPAKVQTPRLSLLQRPLNPLPTWIGHALSPLLGRRIHGIAPPVFWKACRPVA